MKRLLVLLLPLVVVATGCATGVPSAQPADREPSVVAADTSTDLGRAPAAAPTPVRPTAFRMWKFDAPVVPLKLRGTELVPPADPTVLGWWGKRAGATTGTTLLTGHTVHTGGGELDDLEDTPVGSTADVSGTTYEVTSVKVLSKAKLAQRAPALFSQSGEPRLVVVTCEGYDPSTGEYDANVVVVARPTDGNSSVPTGEEHP